MSRESRGDVVCFLSVEVWCGRAIILSNTVRDARRDEKVKKGAGPKTWSPSNAAVFVSI